MIQTILFALGAVLILEGLVYVLAPQALERMLEMMRDLTITARRMMGALMVVVGLILIVLTT